MATPIDRHEFIEQVSAMADSVYDFHSRFGIDAFTDTTTEEEKIKILNRRIVMQLEELGEVGRAINKLDGGDTWSEMGDNLYVALGHMLMTGDRALFHHAFDSVIWKNDARSKENYKLRYMHKEGK